MFTCSVATSISVSIELAWVRMDLGVRYISQSGSDRNSEHLHHANVIYYENLAHIPAMNPLQLLDNWFQQTLGFIYQSWTCADLSAGAMVRKDTCDLWKLCIWQIPADHWSPIYTARFFQVAQHDTKLVENRECLSSAILSFKRRDRPRTISKQGNYASASCLYSNVIVVTNENCWSRIL